MKQKHRISIFSVVALLLAAAVLVLSGCQTVEAPNQTLPTLPTAVPQTDIVPEGTLPPEIVSELSEALEGTVSFIFEVTGADGIPNTQEVITDCETVSEALLAYGLIEGEQGDYGLYVKTVLGETHDYDTDGTYWAFYIDGEYATAGVDATQIVPGSVYAFRAE